MGPDAYHFSKFDQALASCREIIKISDRVADRDQRLERQQFAAAAAAALTLGQRFYLPEGAFVLEGRPLDEDIKSVIRLPYEVVCVLTETHISANPTWEITIGFEIDSGFNRTFKLIAPTEAYRRGFAMMFVLKLAGLVHAPATQQAPTPWAPLPIIGFCHLVEDAPGIRLELGDTIAARGLADMGKGASEFADNANAIANLCAMLSLKNTATATREPPPKVNKKRLSAGKTPLYSYKVLVVDGEAWDSPGTSAGTNEGVRSHLRRGHIRNLGDGRHVWVRATYVHGSRPGFVDKDYKMLVKT